MPVTNKTPHRYSTDKDIRNPERMENGVALFVPPVVVSNVIDRSEKAYPGKSQSPRRRAARMVAEPTILLDVLIGQSIFERKVMPDSLAAVRRDNVQANRRGCHRIH